MPYGHNKTTKKRPSWNPKESKLRPDANAFERVDLNPEAFDRLVAQKGTIAKIYRTTYCPKVKSVDGAEHEIDCTICNGSGWLDLDPICVPVFIQGQELSKLPQVEGFVDGNTVLATFPIGVEMQYFTLVELEDFTDIYMQRVMRAPGKLVDVLKYKACRINVLVDYDNKRYYQDQDFKIDIDGNILWSSEPTASKPADGVPYSIHYEAAVQYRAVLAVHANRFTQAKSGESVEHIKMNEQWYLKKEFLVKRRNFDGVETQQGPYAIHEIVEDV